MPRVTAFQTHMGPKADARTMREINRALVLETLRRNEAITRSDLARESSLAKPTISNIVDALMEEGVVKEIGPGISRSRGGARGRLVGLNPDSAAFVGVHFRTGRTSVAVADACGRIRHTFSTNSFRDSPNEALGVLPHLVGCAMCDAGLVRARLRRVVVAVPGLISHESGTCVLAPNLGWSNVPIRTHLTDALGVEVGVRNSMQAAAIAEARLGPQAATSSFAWVYVGSGIGGAVVLDGRLFCGRRGFAGELGHWKVVDDGEPCTCGRRGCLETVASSRAVSAAAAGLSSNTGEPPARECSAYSLATAASGGDPEARRVVERAGNYVGLAVSYVLNLLDLERVVLDGPMTRAGNFFLECVRASVLRHAMGGRDTPVVRSTVADDVALRGAVLLAMEGEHAYALGTTR